MKTLSDSTYEALVEFLEARQGWGFSEAAKLLADLRREGALDARNDESVAKVAEQLEIWASDGSRPDEWLLKEWASRLRFALSRAADGQAKKEGT